MSLERGIAVTVNAESFPGARNGTVRGRVPWNGFHRLQPWLFPGPYPGAEDEKGASEMPGTIDPPPEPFMAAPVLAPDCDHGECETANVSPPRSDCESGHDPKARLIMTRNLNAFLHRTHK